MTEATYLITGVSGYVGNRVAELLAERIGPARLIVTSRDDATLQEWRDRGANARHADYSDRDGLERAFTGATRMLMVSAMLVGERRRAQHEHAVAAAAAAGVQHIVYLSYLGAGDPDSTALVSEDHQFTEQRIQASGLSYNFMRNSQYADAVAEQVMGIGVATGACVHNSGDGRLAVVSRDDVAAVAAELLLGAGDPNTAYDVTGPELHTYGDFSRLVAEATGLEIAESSLSDDEMYAMWDAMGVPRQASDDPDAPVPWCSDDMVSFGRTIREGGMDVRTDVVERLTGRPAEPLRVVMERYAHTWQRPATPQASN
ncbi:NAD(P)-dependent oxidoreductase [Pseudoclavibacter endophyticus]|uniref:NAD(P)H-binding protein n=1 Tax=Pseudoclavibacter endophyticus TaxID=1778590 RepID=A0A6H9WQB2_9MICO|nr:NAD(P)H-binding protein [Pseudoclavibacter endophyticus]KAB1649177.1 NAD(P)H-binding protein [Pseudoclavibacter endophyticus]GGA64820.1 NAD(P)-dependent oxidoreductase [Pseudoclavibacter endophyticus]